MASIQASPSPANTRSGIVVVGEGFANATEVIVEVAGTGFKAEIVSSANGNFATDAIADHATGTLTSTGQPSATETFTLGTRVYTMRASVATFAGAYEVLIGANASATYDNIKAAVNGAAGAGSTYSIGTEPHPSIFAAQKTATTIVFFAKVAGTDGNALATTETLTTNAFGGGTLSGGAAAGAKGMIWLPVKDGTYTISATDGTNSATTTVRVFSVG